MAEFTPYQSFMEPAVPSASAGRMDPGDVGMSGAGAALADLASGLADAYGKRLREQEETDAVAYVRDEVGTAERLWTERFAEAQQQAVGAAAGFTPDFMAEFDEYRQERMEAAPNDIARQELEFRFERMRSGLFSDALEFETASRQAERAIGFDQSVNNLAAAAFAAPDRFDELTGQALQDIDGAERTWATPKTAIAMRRDARERIAEAAMRGYIQEDPQGALNALTEQADKPSNPIVGALNVEQRMDLAGTARGELSRQLQQRRATMGALSDRIAGAFSVVSAGFQPDPVEMTRIRREVAALGPDAVELSAGLARLERFTIFAEEFRQQTPADMATWIEAEDKRLRNVGAQPEDVARLGMAQAAMERARAGYGDTDARVDDMVTVLSAGMAPDPAMMQSLVDDLQDLGDGKALKRLQDAHIEGGQRRAAMETAPVEARAALAAAEADMRDRPVSADEVERLEDAKAMHADVVAALGKDPVGFGQRIGIVDPQIIDLSDPTAPAEGNPADTDASDAPTAVEAMRRRRAQALALSEKYGQEPVFLSEQEADLWTSVLSQADPDRQLQMFKAIHDGFGDRAPEVLAEVGAKGGAPLALIGGLLDRQGTVPAARDALRGLNVIEADTGRRPTATRTVPVFEEETAGLLDFAPTTAAALHDAATAIYVARGGRAGDEFDDMAYAEALNAALGRTVGPDGTERGGIVEVNGARTIAPRGVTEKDLNGALHAMSDNDWKSQSYSVMGGALHAPRFLDGTDAPAEDLTDARLEPIGDGLYRVFVDDGYLLGDGPGGYFALTLDAEAVDRILGRRADTGRREGFGRVVGRF